MAKSILFLNPSSRMHRGATSSSLCVPPLGLLSLAAVAEGCGWRVQIIDANFLQLAVVDIPVHVCGEPDIVGISVNALTLGVGDVCAKELKRCFPRIKVCYGGPQVSAVREGIFEERDFLDAAFIGESEATLRDLLHTVDSDISFKSIPGIIYRDGPNIIDNGSRELIANLDSLPRPAYHLISQLSLYKARSRAFPVGYIFTSRGCPAACTFCYRSFGNRWRPRSTESVLEEISYLRERYGIRQLDIMDDNFAYDRVRAGHILDKIASKGWGLKINLQVGVRIHSLDVELLKLMKRAGVFKFGFGIESGDPGILRRIRKGLKLEQAMEIVRLSRGMGFITHGYFMMGFPGETKETMQRTIDFAIRLNPHYASFSICTPLPGTEMYDDILRNGRMLRDSRQGIGEGLFAMKGIFQYGEIDPESSEAYCRKAWRDFYSRPGKIADVLGTIRSVGEMAWLIRVLRDMAFV